MDAVVACSSSLLGTSSVASCSSSQSVVSSAASSVNVVVVGRGVSLAKAFFPFFAVKDAQQLKLKQQKKGLHSVLLPTAAADGAAALEVAAKEKTMTGEEVPIELHEFYVI